MSLPRPPLSSPRTPSASSPRFPSPSTTTPPGWVWDVAARSAVRSFAGASGVRRIGPDCWARAGCDITTAATPAISRTSGRARSMAALARETILRDRFLHLLGGGRDIPGGQKSPARDDPNDQNCCYKLEQLNLRTTSCLVREKSQPSRHLARTPIMAAEQWRFRDESVPQQDDVKIAGYGRF